jgi:hypothetical protein
VYVNTNYIRGFTGGWKSVCVGLSTWKSIRVTHTPDGMSMSLDRNRMHAVLDEMGRHLERRLGRRIFKIDTLLAGPRQAAQVLAGGVDETRRAALAVQAQRFPPRRTAAPTPCDILVYGVPDTSPYAIWASVNPILTLISMGLGYLGGMIDAAGAPGCTVVMAAAVRDAWDRVHHPSYLDVWERVLTQTRDPYEISARFEDEFARHRHPPAQAPAPRRARHRCRAPRRARAAPPGIRRGGRRGGGGRPRPGEPWAGRDDRGGGAGADAGLSVCVERWKVGAYPSDRRPGRRPRVTSKNADGDAPCANT